MITDKKLEYGRVTSPSDDGAAEVTKSFERGRLVHERWRYEERYRVESDREAQLKIAELGKRIEDDTRLTDPAWRYDGHGFLRKRGYFDLVFCYSIIKVIRR